MFARLAEAYGMDKCIWVNAGKVTQASAYKKLLADSFEPYLDLLRHERRQKRISEDVLDDLTLPAAK